MTLQTTTAPSEESGPLDAAIASPDPLIDADLEQSLPAAAYLSPQVFAQERERIFYREWVCAGREEQVPAPGDFLAVDVLGESVLVVRDKDGALHAYYNVCRHRGCRLALDDAPAPRTTAPGEPVPGPTGHFHNAIRCPYHSWTYSFDRGALRGAPFLRESDRFRKEDFSLHPVGLDTWGGFIFLNLTPHEASARGYTLRAQLAEVPEEFKRYPLADLRVAHRIVYEVQANWKVVMENYNECYHCAGVHPELCELVPAFRQHGGAQLDWANGIPHREGAVTFTFSGTSNRAPFPGLDKAEQTRHKGKLIYPNLLTSYSADHVAAFTLWPRSPGHTTVVCDFLFHPSEMSKPDFDPSDAVEFWDLVNKQDWGICAGVQRGMSSRSFTAGYYAPMEDSSLDIRRYVGARLDAAPVS
jgi:Rieske 2Fe-2S family protein